MIGVWAVMGRHLRIVVVVLLGVLLVGGCFLYRSHIGQSEEITLYGNVDVRQVDLGFRVFGRVEKLFFEEGDRLNTGDLVALLEKKPYTDRLTQAKAAVSSIIASMENEEKKLKRRLELIDSKSVSQEDLDTVFSDYRVLEARLEEARAAVAVAQKDLDDTEIFAPTEGTILTRIREPGSVLNPGSAVYTLSVASPVWIRAFISARDLGRVYPGMKANIYTDTPGAKVYTGQVGFISPVSEFTPKTVETTELRTELVYRIRVYADNPDRGLRQGMPLTVKLQLSDDRDE